MASSFVIACPDCGKQVKVAEENIGRKIKCKECQAVFPIRAPKETPAKKPTSAKPKDEPKPAKAKSKAVKKDDDDDDNPNPYSLAKDDLGIPRCPACTAELEDEEARICLECGFNLLTRQKAGTKAIYEATPEEKFKWRLPGILCSVGFVVLLVLTVIVMVKIKSWMAGSMFEKDAEDGGGWWLPPGFFIFINGMITLFACFYMGRFAYRRLVLHNMPPEQEIEK